MPIFFDTLNKSASVGFPSGQKDYRAHDKLFLFLENNLAKAPEDKLKHPKHKSIGAASEWSSQSPKDKTTDNEVSAASRLDKNLAGEP